MNTMEDLEWKRAFYSKMDTQSGVSCLISEMYDYIIIWKEHNCIVAIALTYSEIKHKLQCFKKQYSGQSFRIGYSRGRLNEFKMRC